VLPPLTVGALPVTHHHDIKQAHSVNAGFGIAFLRRDSPRFGVMNRHPCGRITNPYTFQRLPEKSKPHLSVEVAVPDGLTQKSGLGAPRRWESASHHCSFPWVFGSVLPDELPWDSRIVATMGRWSRQPGAPV